MSTSSDQEVANTIWHQLGGNSVASMIGVKKLTAVSGTISLGGLRIDWKARARGGINCVVISLNARDEYDLEFFSNTGSKSSKKFSTTGIQADELASTVSAVTGLALSL